MSRTCKPCGAGQFETLDRVSIRKVESFKELKKTLEREDLRGAVGRWEFVSLSAPFILLYFILFHFILFYFILFDLI